MEGGVSRVEGAGCRAQGERMPSWKHQSASHTRTPSPAPPRHLVKRVDGGGWRVNGVGCRVKGAGWRVGVGGFRVEVVVGEDAVEAPVGKHQVPLLRAIWYPYTESGQLRAVHRSRHKWPGRLVN